MQTPKLLIFLAVWKRPEITEICFMGIDRLRKTGLFPIEAFAVISEESMIPLCEKYDIDYCFYKNEPVGEKKNYGLSQAYKKEWDYLVEIGSDDLLKNEFLEELKEVLPRDVVSISNLAFLNSEDGECRMYKSKTVFGCGRVLSRRVIDKIGTKLWADRLNRGLDNYSTFFIARYGFLGKRINTEYPLAIDIKSETNIWEFNHLLGVKYDSEKVLEGLSEQEIEAIKSLYVTV